MNDRDKALFKSMGSGERLPDEFLKTYFRTFKLGRLYFKFIEGTELEQQGWTSEKLAGFLASWGVIRIVTIQESDDMGRFTKGSPRYVEMPGKMPTKAVLMRLLKERVGK